VKNKKIETSVIVALIATVSVGFLGISSASYAQNSAASDQPDATTFARGAQTWADNCDRCHNMRDPKEFRADQWRSIVMHMRVRGGLTGGEARDVLFFLQGGSGAPAVSSSVNSSTSNLAAAAQTVNADDGKVVFEQTCIACHGGDGKGAIPGVPDFTAKGGLLTKSDAELIDNITNGFQSPGSFMAMPPKGGNPGLSDADVAAVLAYIRAAFGD